MSRVTNVSNKLAEYMLQGWVLTDTICETANCNVPLMRPPPGNSSSALFCANCDINGSSSIQYEPTVAAPSQSASTVSSRSMESRPSTPPTEISSSLSSPTFAPPIETEDVMRRRQQSDLASSEIGKRLLKGWAMLGEECPNVRCFGIPLVRPPKAGGGKDPRMECVICGTVYACEPGSQQLTIVAPPSESSSVQTAVPGSSRNGSAPSAVPQSEGTSHTRLDRFKSLETTILSTPVPPATKHRKTPSPLISSQPRAVHASTLHASSQALELSLRTLTDKLNALCASPVTGDPSSIGMIAEAISKVAQALDSVKRLDHDDQ